MSSGCKGTAVFALPQSHVHGILHTLDMVCDLPSLWDCGIEEIAVPFLPLNVSELIQQQNVQQPEMVSVQVNEEFAEREDWESIQLKEGDKVDFLYFMGGGAL